MTRSREVWPYRLFLGFLGVLAFLDIRGWLVPGLPWALIGIGGLWLLWSIERIEQRVMNAVSQRGQDQSMPEVFPGESMEGEAHLLADLTDRPPQGQESLLLRLDQLIIEVQGLVQLIPQVVTELSGMVTRVTNLEAKHDQLADRHDGFMDHLNGLIERVDLVGQHQNTLATRVEQVVENSGEVATQSDRISHQNDDLLQHVRRLIDQGAALANQVEGLAAQNAQLADHVQALLVERQALVERLFPAAPTVETVEATSSKSLRKRVRLRASVHDGPNALAPGPVAVPVASSPQPVSPEPSALLARRPFAVPPPVKMQVTTYQRGEPPKQRELNVKIGGRFF